MGSLSKVAKLQLGIFAKFWRAGEVKTRLAAAIGPTAAAEVYRAFMLSLLNRLDSIAERRTVVYTPPEHRGDFAKLAGDKWSLQPQSPGDLGRRMHAFFERSLSAERGPVVLIGSDSPSLPAAYIQQAFELLDSHSAVVGPTEDGGYYLIGLRNELLPVFDGIAWSSPKVYSQTLERLAEIGATFAELPAWYDVDEVTDLRRLQTELGTASFASREWSDLRAAVNVALAEV